jgi:hypothetical protein
MVVSTRYFFRKATLTEGALVIERVMKENELTFHTKIYPLTAIELIAYDQAMDQLRVYQKHTCEEFDDVIHLDIIGIFRFRPYEEK